MNLPVDIKYHIIGFVQNPVVALLNAEFYSVWKRFINIQITPEVLSRLLKEKDVRSLLPSNRSIFSSEHLRICSELDLFQHIGRFVELDYLKGDNLLMCARCFGKNQDEKFQELCIERTNKGFLTMEENSLAACATFMGFGESKGASIRITESLKNNLLHSRWCHCGLVLSLKNKKEAKIFASLPSLKLENLSVAMHVLGRLGKCDIFKAIMFGTSPCINETRKITLWNDNACNFFRGCYETGKGNLIQEMVDSFEKEQVEIVLSENVAGGDRHYVLLQTAKDEFDDCLFVRGICDELYGLFF